MTVTGLDTKGQMFRQSVSILSLDERECVFRSKSQPELDASVLVEFSYPQADTKRRVSQARVKSNYAEIDSGLYRVEVELEIAQTVKVSSNGGDARFAAPKPAPPEPNRRENKIEPAAAPRDVYTPPKPNGVLRTFPQPSQESGAAPSFDNRDLLPKTSPVNSVTEQEAIKIIVASEVKDQMQLLKNWITTELERVVPSILSPRVEKMVSEAVEKNAAAYRQTSTPSLDIDLARQIGDRLGDRIATNQDLQTSLGQMAKKLCDEQIELARLNDAKVEQELRSRADTILQSLEQSAARMESRINSALEGIEQQVSSRVAASINSLEQSAAEIEANVQGIAARIEPELNSRMAASVHSLEESVAEAEERVRGVASGSNRNLARARPSLSGASRNRLLRWKRGPTMPRHRLNRNLVLARPRSSAHSRTR